jgi:alpha-D-ribose 1-methylphosphonate 5-triphosphate synthase subunit PhnL
MLDEATASLDPGRRETVLRVLMQRKRAGTALLAVFHDVPKLRGLVDRVVSMRGGRVAA